MRQLYRSDPSVNMHRFYYLDLQTTLFGEICLVRNWGRIGQSGQVMYSYFATRQEAEIGLIRLCETKEKRGYRAQKLQSPSASSLEISIPS